MGTWVSRFAKKPMNLPPRKYQKVDVFKDHIPNKEEIETAQSKDQEYTNRLGKLSDLNVTETTIGRVIPSVKEQMEHLSKVDPDVASGRKVIDTSVTTNRGSNMRSTNLYKTYMNPNTDGLLSTARIKEMLDQKKGAKELAEMYKMKVSDVEMILKHFCNPSIYKEKGSVYFTCYNPKYGKPEV